MGVQVSTTRKDIFEFHRRLMKEGSEFIRMLQRSNKFKTDVVKIGAELEMDLIDKNTKMARCISPQILNYSRSAGYSGIGPELAQFNIELNTPPIVVMSGGKNIIDDKDFIEKLYDSLKVQSNLLSTLCSSVDSNATIAMHGIWPLLSEKDTTVENMYPNPRYRMLYDNNLSSRNGNSNIVVEEGEGIEIKPLTFMHESLNTSFQLHFSADPSHISDIHNVAMLATPVVLALSANSPFVFGRYVNDESRILMLEKSTDFRTAGQQNIRMKRARFPVSFLDRVDEWFFSAMSEEPILPVIDTGEYIRPKDCELYNRLPRFNHLLLHMSTIWTWIRLKVYSSNDNTFSLGIEIRPLPSGPTYIDMVANAALYYGLIGSFMKRGVQSLIKSRDYANESNLAHELYDNFYDVAKRSANEKVLYPKNNGEITKEPLENIADEVIKDMSEGLHYFGASDKTIEKYKKIISERIEKKMSPAIAQVVLFNNLISNGKSREDALKYICDKYLDVQAADVPFISNFL